MEARKRGGAEARRPRKLPRLHASPLLMVRPISPADTRPLRAAPKADEAALFSSALTDYCGGRKSAAGMNELHA